MGHWVIEWGGQKYNSDDFTLDELGQVEKETETPWSVLNVLREVKVARAFLRVVLAKAGVPEGETLDSYLAGLTLGKIKHVFSYESDEDDAVAEDDADPLESPPSTSPSSSPGVSDITTGSRKKRVVNESAISS